jgi:hypothetical protein
MTTASALDPTTIGRSAEDLERSLHRMIVVQEEAVQQIVWGLSDSHYESLCRGWPIGNFLF